MSCMEKAHGIVLPSMICRKINDQSCAFLKKVKKIPPRCHLYLDSNIATYVCMYEKCESAWLTWIEINDQGVNVMSIRYILYNLSIFAYFVRAWGLVRVSRHIGYLQTYFKYDCTYVCIDSVMCSAHVSILCMPTGWTIRTCRGYLVRTIWMQGLDRRPTHSKALRLTRWPRPRSKYLCTYLTSHKVFTIINCLLIANYRSVLIKLLLINHPLLINNLLIINLPTS
jgi:hypothetical protein